MSEFMYKASDWGALFHSLRHHEALGAGAAGPGKSLVLLFDPMDQLQTEHARADEDYEGPHPIVMGQSAGWALHLRREAVMLDQTLERAALYFHAIDPDVKFDKETKKYTFSCGYKYQFGHCKDPGDWQKYLSNQYTWIGFDELTQFEKEQYMQICTRLRSADPVLRHMLKIRAMSNPFCAYEGSTTVKDVNWVRERFVDPAPEGKKTIKKVLSRKDGSTFERTRVYLPATLYDNPDKEYVKQYEENLLDKPMHIQQAMLYGNWYVNPGSHYGDDWNPQIHVCKPFKIPSHWRRVRGMDWGFKSHGVVVWGAIDEEGTLYIEREFSFRGLKAGQVARRMKEIEKDMGLWAGVRSGIPGWADTQLWEERGETAKQKSAEFQEVGINWHKADKRSRVKNSERLSQRLKDHKKMSTRPGIVFFETCRDCIRTIPAIPTNPDRPEEPLEGGADHWHDAVVYLVAGVSREGVGSSADAVEEMEDALEDPVVEIERGRNGYGS